MLSLNDADTCRVYIIPALNNLVGANHIVISLNSITLLLDKFI